MAYRDNIIDNKNTFVSPVCNNCKNYIKDATCKAFKRRIPIEILNGKNKHKKPLPEQKNNIVFEKIK